MYQPTTSNVDTVRRTTFIGRVQEQRQFQVALQGLLAHHDYWNEIYEEVGDTFDASEAPGDDGYAHIFLLQGIGGIGKTWLTHRCLGLAREIEHNTATILACYIDFSIGQIASDFTYLMNRIFNGLVDAGYREELSSYRQVQVKAPKVAERVVRYQVENREKWDSLVQAASSLLARGTQIMGRAYGLPIGEYSASFIKEAGSEVIHSSAATIAKAYDMLVEHMQDQGELDDDDAFIFHDPVAAQAAKLVVGLKAIALKRPFIVALDTLEVIVYLEPYLRDLLILPTLDAPVIWILSGRHNLADERVVEIQGEKRIYKGYRDLLGQNPPIVWNMTLFSDMDLRQYLELEGKRRDKPIAIESDLVTSVKKVSGGVPLAVEMVSDAFFTLDHEQFLENFKLDDQSMLPIEKMELVTDRFLRYCLTQKEDLQRVQGMALLLRKADERALRKIWDLSKDEVVSENLIQMRSRYAFVNTMGLHDAIYRFVRQELLTLSTQIEVRQKLAERAVEYYKTEWETENKTYENEDSALRTRDPRWQKATQNLLNALFWLHPDKAVRFLVLRFIEGLGFDLAFADGLILLADEFMGQNTIPIRGKDANLIRNLRLLTKEIGPGFADGKISKWFGYPTDSMHEALVLLSNVHYLEPLHLSIVALWHSQYLDNKALYKSVFSLEPSKWMRAIFSLVSQSTSLIGPLIADFEAEFSFESLIRETIASLKDSVDIATIAKSDEELRRSQLVERLLRRLVERVEDVEERELLRELLLEDEEFIKAVREYVRPDNEEFKIIEEKSRRGLLWEREGISRFLKQLINRYTEQVKDDAVQEKWKAVNEGENIDQIVGLLDSADMIEILLEDLEESSFTEWAEKIWGNDETLGLIYREAFPVLETVKQYMEEIRSKHPDALKNLEESPQFDAMKSEIQSIIGMSSEGYYQALEILLEAERHLPINALELRNEFGYALMTIGDAIKDSNTATDEDLSIALTAYRKAIKLGIDTNTVYRNLGMAELRVGEVQQALTSLQRAVSLKPEDARAFYWLGVTNSELERDSDAAWAFKKHLDLNPNNHECWHDLSVIYRDMELYEDAIKACQKANDSAPQTCVYLSDLAHYYMLLNQDMEAQEALNEAEGLINLQQYHYAWVTLATLRYRQQAEVEGKQYFERALQYWEPEEDPWEQMTHAWLLVVTGQREKGLELLQDTLELYEPTKGVIRGILLDLRPLLSAPNPPKELDAVRVLLEKELEE